MLRLLLILAATAVPLLAGPAAAGGIAPLACSQGNEIRTIDYYMDVNMAQMQEIEGAEMSDRERRAALEANTAEFIELQNRRQELTQACAIQIKNRNEYYQQ